MKILIVTNEYPPDYGGGIATYCREIALAYRQLGHEVRVLKGSVSVQSDSTHEPDRDVNILERKRFEAWFSKLESYSIFPTLRGNLASAFAMHEQVAGGEDYDAVEVIDWGMSFVPWVTETKCKVIVQMHSSSGQISHFEPRAGDAISETMGFLIEVHALRLAKIVSTYSVANQRWWQNVLRKDVQYIPPPLDASALPFSGASGDGTWLGAGRIQKWKGPQILCQAWQSISSPPTCFWAGRDMSLGENGLPTTEWLAERYADVWEHSVRSLGELRPDELVTRMASSKGLIVPSTWDVFNFVAAETMAIGKVLIVSDGAGASALVESGVDGFVFENGNSGQLAEIVAIVENMQQHEREAIGAAARRKVLDQLDPIAVAESKLQLIEDGAIQQCSHDLLIDRIRDGGCGHEELFFDQFALKSLLNYSAKRITKKIFSRR